MRATQQFITMPPTLVISIWPAYSASRGLSSDGCRLKSGFELNHYNASPFSYERAKL